MNPSSFNDLPEVRHLRLTVEHTLKPFDCGNLLLNNFLLKDSKTYLQHLLSVTYLIEVPDHIVAYYSLSNDILRISANKSREFKGLLRRKVQGNILYNLFDWGEFPAVKIGRFAIDGMYQRKGIGSELLEAIIYSFLINNKTGCAFITVDAINDQKVIDFYQKNGFVLLTEKDLQKDSRLMYRCLI